MWAAPRKTGWVQLDKTLVPNSRCSGSRSTTSKARSTNAKEYLFHSWQSTYPGELFMSRYFNMIRALLFNHSRVFFWQIYLSHALQPALDATVTVTVLFTNPSNCQQRVEAVTQFRLSHSPGTNLTSRRIIDIVGSEYTHSEVICLPHRAVRSTIFAASCTENFLSLSRNNEVIGVSSGNALMYTSMYVYTQV